MQEELVSLGQRETEGCLCQENKNSPWIGLNNPFFRLNKKKELDGYRNFFFQLERLSYKNRQITRERINSARRKGISGDKPRRKQVERSVKANS